MKIHRLIPFMLLSCPALAQQSPIEKVYACADIVEASQRHACFDALVPELKQARSASRAGPATPAVKQQPQAAELGAPRVAPSLLTAPVADSSARAAAAPAPAVDRVTLAVKAISTGPDGKSRFTMDNGQVWRQVDTTKLRNLGSGPWTAEIRKAALGSFLLSVNKSAAVRVERVN